MVEVGRKAHRRHVSELEARKAALAEIAREVEAVRVRQAEEAAREEARLRRAGESVREAEAARARQAACQAPDPTPPEATTTSEATHDEAAGAPLGPDPSGDAQDEPASGDVPESGTSIGGPSRAASSPRRLSPMPSAAPLSAEPLLQALAAANTTVLDGLSAQMEVLQAERAELDAAWARVEEGRRSVEAMVEAGRKAHRRQGECCVWWGAWIVAAAAGAAWTVVSPLLMTLLLLKVSGVALLEKDIGARRPAYADYVRRTNAFIPWRPRA